MANIKKLLAVLLGLLVVAAMGALPALASSFEFSGTGDGKGVHLHSQGRINFQWVPITGSNPPNDPVNNLFWGANDLRVFDAIGQTPGLFNLQAGSSFTGLDYTLPMWLDSTDLPDIKSQDQGSGYTGWDFTGTMHITSISFPSNYDIIIGGRLTDMINRVTGSTVLTDMAAANSVDFTINIVRSSKTPTDFEQGFLTALNSGELSSWANLTGSSAVIPEPGTLGLLASALLGSGGMAWVRRRRAEAASPPKGPSRNRALR